jgi:hypothetical protein
MFTNQLSDSETVLRLVCEDKGLPSNCTSHVRSAYLFFRPLFPLPCRIMLFRDAMVSPRSLTHMPPP